MLYIFLYIQDPRLNSEVHEVVVLTVYFETFYNPITRSAVTIICDTKRPQIDNRTLVGKDGNGELLNYLGNIGALVCALSLDAVPASGNPAAWLETPDV